MKGKVALIAGGVSSIFFEIARQFGLHGVWVAITGDGNRSCGSYSAVASPRSLGFQAVGLEGDVRKEVDASRVVETVVNAFGRLHILINGAAGNFLVAPEDFSPNGFKTVCSYGHRRTWNIHNEPQEIQIERELNRAVIKEDLEATGRGARPGEELPCQEAP